MVPACPDCRRGLAPDPDTLDCAGCGARYPIEDGIARLLIPADRERVAGFLAGYQRVRAAEGWGSDDPAWHRALPRVPESDPHREIWRIRALSLRALGRALADLPAGARVADLGAGCCWLSARLADAGFAPIAIDLNDDPRDGLGAGRLHAPAGAEEPGWPRIQAAFERLPLSDGSVDAVVWNASLHYAADVSATLAEGMRVLRPGGLAIIVDSPIYRDPASGAAMVAERAADLRMRFGIEPAPGDPVGYLTRDGLDAAARELGITWRTVRPWYGLGWALRPWRARIRGNREPATFAILVATPPRRRQA